MRCEHQFPLYCLTSLSIPLKVTLPVLETKLLKSSQPVRRDKHHSLDNTPTTTMIPRLLSCLAGKLAHKVKKICLRIKHTDKRQTDRYRER